MEAINPHKQNAEQKTALIIGGGVAGLSAATALADNGLHVMLYEKRGSLGGRASSFVDQTTGDMTDNCQHITMRCCTNLEHFYRRIGVMDHIQFYKNLIFVEASGRRTSICGSFIPAPFHTMPSFSTFHALSMLDKLAVARALIAMLRLHPVKEYDNTSMADWLSSMHQTPRAMERFWRTILVSACNEELDRISCSIGFKIFRDGFLANAQAYQMGVPSVPLAEIYTEPAMRCLKEKGADVTLKRHVISLQMNEGAIESALLSDGAEVKADFYLSAVPFDLLLKLLSSEFVQSTPFFERFNRFEFSPITGVHLWFDRPIPLDEPLALFERQTQWIFPRTCQEKEGAARLALVVSSSRGLIDQTADEIIQRSLDDVHQALPASRNAKLVSARVIKEKKATFAPLPGVQALRPSQRTPVTNLILAGDWTDTGWPATMEGAARSGYLAAECILHDTGKDIKLLQPDLPPSALARMLLG
jgi:zeta-carotene desaturase